MSIVRHDLHGYGSAIAGGGGSRGGKCSSQSWTYIIHAFPNWFTFETHPVRRADSRARANTGNKIAARMAIMAITTSNSISVNPDRERAKLRMAFSQVEYSV